MNKKLLPIIIVVAVVGMGASFYGGMKYVGGKSAMSTFSRGNFQDMQNLSPEERQQGLAKIGIGRNGGIRGGFAAAGSLTGEVLSRSETGFTVKLVDGSTKIVFVSGSTQISKTVDGTTSDFVEGEQVFVMGTENSDGSYTADNVQLNPANRGQMPTVADGSDGE